MKKGGYRAYLGRLKSRCTCVCQAAATEIAGIVTATPRVMSVPLLVVTFDTVAAAAAAAAGGGGGGVLKECLLLLLLPLRGPMSNEWDT